MRGNELADESDGESHVQRRGYERREWDEQKMTLIRLVCHSQARGRLVPSSAGLIIQALRIRATFVSLKSNRQRAGSD